MTNDTMRTQTADPNKIHCRDCLYREKDTMKIDGEVVQTGIMRGTCLVFDGKRGNWKPTSVTLDGERCPLYEWDETADRFWERKGKK